MKKILFLFAACAMLIAGTSCERIDAGHEGILVDLFGSDKGVQDVHLVTGWVYYNPITQKVYEYPTFVQTVDYEPFTINAKDGSEFVIDPSLNLKIVDGKAPQVFRKYRKDLKDVIAGPIYKHVKDACRIEINKFTTDSIVSNREKLEDAIENRFKSLIKNEGFELDQFTSGLQYPKTIVEAVNAKNRAIQLAQKSQNEVKVAEAEAQKLVVAARAEKEANELRTKALTPQVLEMAWIEKWDGKLPVYGTVPTIFKDISK